MLMWHHPWAPRAACRPGMLGAVRPGIALARGVFPLPSLCDTTKAAVTRVHLSHPAGTVRHGTGLSIAPLHVAAAGSGGRACWGTG